MNLLTTRTIGILLIVVAMLLPVPGSFGETKVLSVSLKDQGWMPSTRESGNEMRLCYFSRVSFGDADTIYVGYPIKVGDALHREGEATKAFRVLSINTVSGTVSRRQEFEIQSEYSKNCAGLFVSAAGSLVVIVNDRIQSIGVDGTVLKAFQFVPQKDEYHLRGFNLSASGQTVDLWDLDAHHFYRTDSFLTVAGCTGSTVESRPLTFNDDTQMSFLSYWPNPRATEIVSAPLCGQFKPLPWRGDHPGAPELLFPDSSVLGLGLDMIRLWSQRGDLLWAQVIVNSKHLKHGQVLPSRNGARFAIEWIQERGGSDFFDTDPRMVARFISVYDSHTGKQLAAIKTPLHGLDGFALSPKGDMLAIRYDGNLEVWKI